MPELPEVEVVRRGLAAHVLGRTIEDVVRLGRVRAVSASAIRLDDGEIPLEPGTLVIDCSARGLSPSPPVPIFAGDAVRLQQVRHNSPTFNAALIAFLSEVTDRRA